ncbi:hypothetical protein BMS3Bbin06_00567 [bacterium BMS3Bbin06]|nr:hypothetical protein BMS3Bbin06_00567 [bacterium BMS3Bbin06]HDO36508.1 hypothetical protein [Nitrospirota bacterium]
MRLGISSKGTIYILCFVLVAVFAMAGAADAQVLCNQGTSFHIQDEARVADAGNVYFGWGLDFDLNSANSTWIHTPIPSVLFENTQILAVVFYTGSSDAWVDRIDVWNGDTRVKIIDGLHLSGDQAYVIDLGTDIPAVSLSISARVNAGVEQDPVGGHRFVFYTACAEFHP